MKLRYFIPAFIALLGAMLVSCSDDDKITLLDEIQVSRSYVAIDKEGGSTSIIVTAKDAWSFDDIEKNIYPYFEKYNNEKVRLQVTSYEWIDVYSRNVSKGSSVKTGSSTGMRFCMRLSELLLPQGKKSWARIPAWVISLVTSSCVVSSRSSQSRAQMRCGPSGRMREIFLQPVRRAASTVFG